LPSLTYFASRNGKIYKLVSVIAKSLDNLKKALKGLAVMSEDVD